MITYVFANFLNQHSNMQSKFILNHFIPNCLKTFLSLLSRLPFDYFFFGLFRVEIRLQFCCMSEENIKEEAVTQRMRNMRINQQVVKLLKQKTIPLNRARYLRLQTISKTITKINNSININASAPHFNLSRPPQLPHLSKARTSRGQALPTADLLINRLKNLKHLKQSSQLLLKDEQAGRCWQVLRSSIIQSEQTGRKDSMHPSAIPSQKTMKIISQGGRRKRQNLLQLAQKAERHLRIKKHELKQRHCQQEEYIHNRRKKQIKPTEIQMILTTFKDLKQHSHHTTDQQMQQELLRDIRETMLEEKINRIKKDINHKKIVQLR